MAILWLKGPTSLAFLLHFLGCSIFSPHSLLSPEIFNSQQPSQNASPPVLSSAIVSLGVAILLSQYSLWPSVFRKPPKALLFVIQLLFSLFILEFTLNVIWFPLEGIIYDLWQMLAQMTTNPAAKKRKTTNLSCEIIQFIVDIIGCSAVPGLASYIMSIAFLACILHITRIQDVYKSSC